jgi:hypothetical protein
MKCKGCGREIEEVRIYSKCYRWGLLSGNKVVSHGSVEECLDTLGIECPKCDADMTNEVEEAPE